MLVMWMSKMCAQSGWKFVSNLLWTDIIKVNMIVELMYYPISIWIRYKQQGRSKIPISQPKTWLPFNPDLQRQPEHPKSLLNLRQPSSPDVNLQRLMQQPRRIKHLVTLISHIHKFFLRDVFPNVLVQFLLVTNTHPWNRFSPVRRIVMTWPDLDLVRQFQKFTAWLEEIFGVATGEVAAGCADVCVEERVAAEHIVWIWVNF